MLLIAILFALGAEKLFPAVQVLRHFDWLGGYSAWLRPRMGALEKGASGVLIVIGPPVLLIGVSYFILHQIQWLLGFAFNVVVLLLCLGPRHLDEQIERYIKSRESNDTEAAHRAAGDLLHEQVSGPSFHLNRAVTESILVQSNERVFAVLFWFALLPPFGAVLYRLSLTLKQVTAKERGVSEFARAAARLHAILDWVPARLVALGYATTGSFVDALSHWRASRARWAGKWEDSSVGVLLASGIGALQLNEDTTPPMLEDAQAEIHEIKSAQALVWRTLVTWIVIIALMVLAGLAV
ncbi:MAG: regulatory signaling modulator protein AmpE [Proteobacteria bacterium]|nr:regulatory signaling modulator protein AmpE [Pseudomonadota bacterium]